MGSELGNFSTRREVLAATGATTLAGVAGCMGGDDGENTIRYAGVTGALVNDLLATFNLSDHMTEEVFEYAGEEYEFEFLDVASTPEVVRSLGSGEADLGLLAYSSLANAIEEDILQGGATVIAPLTYDGPRYADTYCATAGSDITDPADLEGGSLAVNGIGTAIDIAARYVFVQEGVDVDSVQFQEIDFPAMAATLADGTVDAATFVQPFYQQNESDLQVVFDTADAFGDFLKIFVTARDDFLADNAEPVEYMLEDFWTGLQWWADDANSEQRLDIATEVIGLDRAVLEPIIGTDADYYHGEDGLRIDPAWIQAPIDGMQEVGEIEESIDVSEYVDNAYLSEAANVEPSTLG
ncbi:ABC transporter substrate-binding protein [Halovivax cerinus]|uniref:ABC transporter substrate-binding protein n=1 Tax=Halovivax cerinus TaxID=1487865 RepID=A0ABD5NQF2_9EURY|nr:ABC transporter substrate-binding protein [Halovivax cerinus]